MGPYNGVALQLPLRDPKTKGPHDLVRNIRISLMLAVGL